VALAGTGRRRCSVASGRAREGGGEAGLCSGRQSKGKNVNAWEGARGRERKGIAVAVVRVGNDVPIFSRRFIHFSSRDIQM
jgi:hypothetical protein